MENDDLPDEKEFGIMVMLSAVGPVSGNQPGVYSLELCA